MKVLKYFSCSILILLLFSSCEDVIELDLQTSVSQLVIEANLDAGSQTATVELSKSNDFYDTEAPESVSDATIVLSNSNGAQYALTETSVGVYHADSILSMPGDVFTIEIEIDDQLYIASSEVPMPVRLDEVIVAEAGDRPFANDDEGTLMLSARWNDPENIENFYRIRSFVDDSFIADSYTLINDDFIGDGSNPTVPIRDLFEENTNVRLELMSTDKNYYDYFFQLSSLTGEGGGSTTPYNPNGNFNQEVLGYFGIYYVSTISVEL